jgi:sulfotransferase
MNKKKMYFLSGLPRSGSTLLSSILSQNPKIHAEGNSAVCQLMWDMQISCQGPALQQLLANSKYNTQDSLVSAIPFIYYKNVSEPYIIDKCRSWTLPDNMQMIKRYITKNPKVIVLTRPLKEILHSFSELRKRNGMSGDTSDLLQEDSDAVMRSLKGVQFAKNNNDGEFLFISYDDLVDYTQDVLASIYDFCQWEKFEHDLNNIKNKYPENDQVYGLLGMHDVRPTIGRRQ